jgi:hypothetical protein
MEILTQCLEKKHGYKRPVVSVEKLRISSESPVTKDYILK